MLVKPTIMTADHAEGGALPTSEGNQAMPPSWSTMPPISSQGPSWMDDIHDFLNVKKFFPDDAIVERIARQSKRNAMVDGDIYRQGTNGVLLWCITREEGRQLLILHQGECGSHSSSYTMVGKSFDRVLLANNPPWRNQTVSALWGVSILRKEDSSTSIGAQYNPPVMDICGLRARPVGTQELPNFSSTIKQAKHSD